MRYHHTNDLYPAYGIYWGPLEYAVTGLEITFGSHRWYFLKEPRKVIQSGLDLYEHRNKYKIENEWMDEWVDYSRFNPEAPDVTMFKSGPSS